MKRTIVLGASTNPNRYSNKACLKLIKNNIPIIPMGIKKGFIEGIEIENSRPQYSNIHTITLYLNPTNQKDWCDYLISLKPKRIIFNPGTENKDFMELCLKNLIEVVQDCTLVMLNNSVY